MVAFTQWVQTGAGSRNESLLPGLSMSAAIFLSAQSDCSSETGLLLDSLGAHAAATPSPLSCGPLLKRTGELTLK